MSAHLLKLSSSGLAPGCRNLNLLSLKDDAALHMFTEVVRISGTYDEIVSEILEPVRVIVSTVDGATKLLANLAAGPAKTLHNNCRIALAIIDEGQRCEFLPGSSILGHVQTALVLADSNQSFEPPKP